MDKSVRRNAKTMPSLLLLITVLSVGFQDIAAGAVSPAIAAICASFPNIPTSTIQLIVTLPTLLICVVSPIYGWLSNKIQPRKLIIFGLGMFIVGGMLPVCLNSLVLIMICRAALGIGSGITIPAALSIIPVFYEGKMRDRLIGFNQAVGSMGCIFMQLVGGLFADIDWHLSFLAYGFGLISFLLVVFFLPDVPMDQVQESAQGEPKKNIFKSIPPRVYGLALVFLVCMIFVCIPTTNLSLMIVNAGIGTAASAGLALSIYTVGSMIGSAAFGYVKKAIGRHVFALSYIVCGAGFFLVSTAKSMTALYCFMIIAGLGMGCLMCSYIGRAAEVAKLAFVAFSISMITSANGLGNFIHPAFVGWMDGILGNIYGQKAILFAGVALIVMGVLTGIVYAVRGIKIESKEV